MSPSLPPATNASLLRQDCWTNAVNAFGTGVLFERRAGGLRTKINVVTYLGIAVPLAVGGAVLALGTGASLLPVLVGVAGVLGLAQLLASAWSLAAGWPACHAYAQEAASDNYRLANQFQSLGKAAPPDLASRFAVLEAEYQARSAMDTKQALSDEEKRRGMRAALRHYQRKCAQCQTVPKSMTPTDCDVCGNFNP